MHSDWIACIIVLLSFSPIFSCFHTKDGEKYSLRIKDRYLVIQTVMSDADNASINCPGLEVNKESVHITLYKDTELHFTVFQKTQVTNTSKEKQRFSAHVKNDTVDYVIDMPQVSDTGLYNCTVAHGDAAKTTHTYLLVTDPRLPSSIHEGQTVSWLLLAAGCGLLALYNIISTIVSCFFAWKLKHQDTYQNDYFNTRPGEFSKAK
ncbi:hypothetical protein PHYPO_G00207420 [Pangasianodon hypophthalmus]|uniref:Immunoglobulin V-set domain-containing protein n=1 Tax=Pangasianodon hypophthalmus TaxID=310915 RepID=A0A5N5PE51_PANHP|nr:hypothetical protein PHYPO_G00207420 [Pangasianodon hypophthalmus]